MGHSIHIHASGCSFRVLLVSLACLVYGLVASPFYFRLFVAICAVGRVCNLRNIGHAFAIAFFAKRRGSELSRRGAILLNINSSKHGFFLSRTGFIGSTCRVTYKI